MLSLKPKSQLSRSDNVLADAEKPKGKRLVIFTILKFDYYFKI